MGQLNVSEIPTAGAVESTLKAGAAAGLVADADFATDLTTTLANITTRNAKVHVNLTPAVLKVKEAVKVGFTLLGNTVMTGGSLSTIYTAIPGTWPAAFAFN